MMKEMVRTMVLFILLAFHLSACKNSERKENKLEQNSTYNTTVDFGRTVEQILDQGPQYNSFLKLVNAAGYFDEIYSRDDITVFVPSDDAFGPSLKEINDLSNPDNLDRLRKILDYHVVKGEYDMENLLSTTRIQNGPMRLETFNGGYLAVRMENDTLKILDESTNLVLIGETCVQGSNGTVYSINNLLMPRSQMTDTAEMDGNANGLLP